MDCRSAAESFSEHADGALESARAAALEAHLVACLGCAKSFAETRALCGLIRSLPQASLPAGFHARLEARRARGVETPSSRPGWPRYAAFATAGLALMLVVRATRPPRRAALEAPAFAPAETFETVPSAPAAALRLEAPAPDPTLKGDEKSGRPFGAPEKPDNEQLYRSLKTESEELGLEPADKPAEAPRRAFLGKPGAHGNREQAEASIQELAAMRRAFEEADNRPRGVAIKGRTAPLLSMRDEAGSGPLEGDAPAAEAWSGPYSAGLEGTRTIESEKDWRALWKLVAKGPAPSVDFQSKQVVGVFIGPRPSGGFAVEILGASRTETAMVVQFRETSPAPGRTPPEGASSPYALRVIERSDLPIRYQKLK